MPPGITRAHGDGSAANISTDNASETITHNIENTRSTSVPQETMLHARLNVTMSQHLAEQNDPIPMAMGERVFGNANIPLDIILWGASSNASSNLIATLTKDPSHGVLSWTGSESDMVTYTPDRDYVGEDHFSFKVSNGEHISTQEATVFIYLNHTNVQTAKFASSQQFRPGGLVNLTAMGQFANPRVAESRNGNVYLVWEDDGNGGDILFSKSEDGGNSFSNPTKVNTDGGASSPQLVASGDNVIVLWNKQPNMVELATSTDGGNSFGNQLVWGEESNDIGGAQLSAIGENNVLVLLYGLTDDSPHPIFLARSNDGGRSFGIPAVVTNNATITLDKIPQMVTSENKIVYVAWHTGDKMLLTRSTDAGITFGETPHGLFSPWTCTDSLRLSAEANNVYATCIIEAETTVEGATPGTHAYVHYRVLMYSGSSDFGTTFSPASSLTASQDNQMGFLVGPVTISSGETDAYIGYNQNLDRSYLIRISDNQTNFHKPVVIGNNAASEILAVGNHGSQVYLLGVTRSPHSSGNEVLYFTSSLDQEDSTFETPIILDMNDTHIMPEDVGMALSANGFDIVWAREADFNTIIQFTRIAFPLESEQLAKDRPSTTQNNENAIPPPSEGEEGELTLSSPADIQSLIDNGTLLYNSGDFEGALGEYVKAIKIDSHNLKAWNGVGASLIHLGRNDEALTIYPLILKNDPNFAEAWNNMATALINLGRYDEALQAANKAIEIRPNYEDAWINVGTALDKLGRPQDALQAANRALEIDPDNAVAWNNRGVALDDLGQHKEAIEAYDKALEIDPSFSLAKENRAISVGSLDTSNSNRG